MNFTNFRFGSINLPKPTRAFWTHLAIRMIAVAPGGCSRIPILNDGAVATVLQPEDFAPEVTTEQASAPSRTLPARSTEFVDSSPEAVLSVREGAPQVSEGSASPVERPVLIESKVGDVNGKPIFATEFLEPMAARMTAEAERMPRPQWVPWAYEQIERGLQEIITDELLRAEALSRLSPEQKQGLRAFLTNIRGDLASGAAGSRSLAAKRLAEEEGMTEDEFIRSKEQEALIRTTLFRDIDNRVNVSWRDIEQRYQRDFENYNPPATAVFRFIRVPTDDVDAVAFVNDAIANGRPFAEIISESKSNYKPDEGGLDEIPIQDSLEETELFGGRILNEQAHSVAPGEIAGPFELGSYTGWLSFEEIRQESVSLYDAQLVIYDQITTERRSKELQRFMKRLQNRASFSSLQEMRDRIFAVADRRYGRSAPTPQLNQP